MSVSRLLDQLAIQAGVALADKSLMLATAESCTGGLVAAAITDVSGSSGWFERGFVTYSNEAKSTMLGVPAKLIRDHGAVSEEVARAMAEGALLNSRAQVALSVTGVAGPNGGTPEKPVGMVCFGWSNRITTHTETQRFRGDRGQIRRQAAEHAMRGLLELIRNEA
ncbi:Nicotinamide-nucleotide amidohydrolase PncC [compost metagenome]|jgi:nicotinamide-nucleotide amidase|uniref:Competence-damage inducible protein CinA n=2 Tax=Cupriavidus necator TaxID=106590 RepID=G0EWG7_CUPNN|nr:MULTISPECIES: CinA family protein [Cupriavidus]AEI78424.1 competence-damage inducible protein CinA [Cupriavidus necator N-1]KAI3598903.1 Nicotinamide-nucleotide amidase [Cupriavidus necator H850]MDX6013052.1 CinA family protein [Cupriavidus necator]QQX83903.1 CinA family protein [Cupriavidus necator]QUN27892.1 CinA family protein [Cupriavidus sp. KK10]